MNLWKKTLLAVALGAGTTVTTNDAQASDTVVNVENDVAHDARFDDDDPGYNVPYELDRRDRGWRRHGIRRCYSYCDNIRDECVRDAYRRGYNWGRLRRQIARCERRFDRCFDYCRDYRWGGR